MNEVIDISKELFEYCENKEKELNLVSNLRPHPNSTTTTSYFRSEADADYARILYSSSFRRLQGKMQLLVPKNETFYRNRMTHSYEVAQFAKIISQRLKLKDTITTQSCSLAHDIGNPPFGHAGEVFLNGVNPMTPYEGNAQTFRTLFTIEHRHHSFYGLNLTIRTLLGLIKYCNPPSNKFRKYLYREDYNIVHQWLSFYRIQHKTIDCEIMDLSDEIAYAIHDLEDTLKLNYFTIDELLYEFSIDSKYMSAHIPLKRMIVQAKQFASQASSYGSSEEYSMLFRKELTSILANSLVNDIDLVDGKLGYKELGPLVSGLKKLTFKCIKRQPEIIEYELLGRHVLTKLYELYTDESYNKAMVLMPANYRDESQWERKVLDYIGGMMDVYAIQQYEKYFGKLKDKGIYFK